MFITQVFILHTFFVPGTEEAAANKTEVPPFMQMDEDCDLRHLVRKGISENVIFEKETGGDEKAGLDDSQEKRVLGRGNKAPEAGANLSV